MTALTVDELPTSIVPEYEPGPTIEYENALRVTVGESCSASATDPMPSPETPLLSPPEAPAQPTSVESATSDKRFTLELDLTTLSTRASNRKVDGDSATGP